MDSRQQIDAVYTDFSKAFDKVHHPTLFVKLSNFGIHGSLFGLLRSYLLGRTQIVKINNSESKEIQVTSGVPQGSHLGPLLFSIFINDIVDCFKFSQCALYADDLKIKKNISTLNDCVLLNEDLNALNEFCAANRIYLNINKCCSITFTRNLNKIVFSYTLNGELLKRVNVVKDLGIYLDTKLSFDHHIESVVHKSFKNLGFILRTTKDFKREKSVLILYNSMVRSHLEYASLVWDPAYNKYINRIEKVQSKLIKHLNYKFHPERQCNTYTDNLKLYRIDSLKNRRLVSHIIFLHKIIHNKIDSAFCLNYLSFITRSYETRGQSLFYSRYSNTNSYFYSPMNNMQQIYNLSFSHIDLFHLSLTQVKNKAFQALRQ